MCPSFLEIRTVIMTRIFNMFGPSPIRPIEQHMNKVHQCAKQLSPFFEAVLQQDWDTAMQIKEKIDYLEKKADIMKQKLRLHLPTGLFLPVARTDLLELLNAQDRIANIAQDIAGLITGRKVILPSPLIPLFLPLLARCLDASHQACKAINELDELLESGFRGSEVSIVEAMIVTLDEIEQDSDAKLATIRDCIFTLENELPTIEIVFLYKLVQWVGDLANQAQIVGGRLQILIAR